MEELSKVILSHIFTPTNLPLSAECEISTANLQELARGVVRLSEIYTRNRTKLGETILQSAQLREAYLAYFLPVNLAKFHLILRELWTHPLAAELFKSGIRFLDLGSGPGSQLLGLLLFLKNSPSPLLLQESVIIDNVRSNLDLARQFQEWCFQEYFPKTVPIPPLKICLADLSLPLHNLGAAEFNLICVGNLLNELFTGQTNRIEKRLAFIETLVSTRLAENGFLVLLEPALRETSRELLFLRNQLLARTGLHVYAPCVHCLPCPAVAPGNETDWCHEDQPWQPPAYLSKIDKLAGIRKSSLKYSYLVLSRREISIRDAFPLGENNDKKSELWRVVSERIEEKGKSYCFLCGKAGRWRVTRLDKNRSGGNQDFDLSARGQVVATSTLNENNSGDYRVEKESLFKILNGPSHPGRT